MIITHLLNNINTKLFLHFHFQLMATRCLSLSLLTLEGLLGSADYLPRRVAAEAASGVLGLAVGTLVQAPAANNVFILDVATISLQLHKIYSGVPLLWTLVDLV